MRTEISKNIFFENFDSSNECNIKWHNHLWWDNYRGLASFGLIFKGKTSKISEDTARKCVLAYYLGSNFSGDYENSEFGVLGGKEMFPTAKKCLESLSEYCVIYEIKEI